MIYAIATGEQTEISMEAALPQAVAEVMSIVNAVYLSTKEIDSVQAESFKKMISDPEAIKIMISDDFDISDAVKYAINKSIELGPDCIGLKDPAKYEEVKRLAAVLAAE